MIRIFKYTPKKRNYTQILGNRMYVHLVRFSRFGEKGLILELWEDGTLGLGLN